MAFDISSLIGANNFPQWFYWATAGVQALGIVVSFVISYLGYKAYKLTTDKKYRYFFYGFLFLGLSFLANMVLNILIRSGYARYFVERRYDPYILPFFIVYYVFLIGVMLAYVSLSVVYSDIKKMNKVWLFYVWTFIIGIYTFRDQILFNMFSAVLISFVVMFTFEKYKEKKNKNMLVTCYAFLFLFLFHVLILAQEAIRIIFVIRYAMLLIGLVLLLLTLLKIYGGKKK
jgi:hypothetical protein